MLDFLLSNLPMVLCALAGMALIMLEVFLPGFGVPGIAGIVLVFVAIGVTLVNYGAVAALGMTILIIAMLAIGISLALKSAAGGSLSKSRLVLNEAARSEEGYDATEDMQVFLGRKGETRTVLRPSGIAEFEGVRLDVVAEGEFIEKDQQVVIERVEGRRIIVRKA